MLKKTRRGLYGLARALGDISAVLSGRPGRIASRAINKKIGRVAGPKLYLKGRRGKR